MTTNAVTDQPGPLHAEPVLPVSDVSETILYWQRVLGFPEQWTWGEPPTLGSVSWHGTAVQFALNPELAAVSKGHAVWIRVRHVESLYQFHQERHADIVAPLENQPWGGAQYVVRDINGYYVCFAGSLVVDKNRLSGRLPDTIKIVGRTPTPSEYTHLASAVYPGPAGGYNVERILASAVTGVVAENVPGGEVTGCALLFGDHASFYYVKDVMVHPDWQHKRVGTALMQALTRWIDTHAPDHMLVTLITSDVLAPFYRQFGFSPAFGMVREINRRQRTGQ